MDVLVVDNDDSFVFTLCDYLRQLGARVDVVRSREIRAGDAEATIRPYPAVLLSPGPGAPRDAGATEEVVRAAAARQTPLLGVCLGHQAIAEVFGGRVDTAPELMHGKVSRVTHAADGLFEGLPPAFIAGRYHSLAVVDGSLPRDQIEVTARTESGTIMALVHRTLPISGVQFHPESVLTEHGFRLLANWLASAGMPQALLAARGCQPLVGESS